MTLPRNAREATVELVLAFAGSHVIASVILLANTIQAQLLSGRATLGEFVAAAASTPVGFASLVFGSHVSAHMTPAWSATVAAAYVTGFVVSVVAIRRVRSRLEDAWVDGADDLEAEEIVTDGGVDVDGDDLLEDVDGVPQWRRIMGALTVAVVTGAACLPLVGVAYVVHTSIISLSGAASLVVAALALIVSTTVGNSLAARVADRVWLTPREREALGGDET